MHVEDHPLEYGGFEGTIPPEQYGGGTVMLWDRGIWIPRGRPVRAITRNGHLKFDLVGDKAARRLDTGAHARKQVRAATAKRRGC